MSRLRCVMAKTRQTDRHRSCGLAYRKKRQTGCEHYIGGYLIRKYAQKADIAFLRLIYGEVKQVDGIIAFGLFSEVEVDFLRSLSTEILFVNSDKKDYEFDQILMDYEQGLNDMVHYLMDEKEYRSIGYIGGIYEDDMVRIGVRRLNGLKQILQKKDCYREDYFNGWVEISHENGYTLTKEMLLTKDVPEVLILGNDEVAEGA